VYEDPDLAQSEISPKSATLAPADLLASIPAALLNELHDAARAARAAVVEEIAIRVNVQSPQAAEMIRSFTKEFRFDAIVSGVEEALRSNGKRTRG
jgi:hypothetical protein